MFAFSPRKELILRVVLIAAILINATIPTVVLAKPLNNNLENQIVGVGENKTYPLIENNYPYPNLERPISRTSENLPQHNSSQSAIDHDATITCLGIYCSDSEPGILVTQNYNGGTYPYLTFSIQCPSSPCASRDIYWHASIQFTFSSIYVYDNFYANILGYGWDSTSYQEGNGGVYGAYCGKQTGSCEFDVYGVIPAEKISGDPSEPQHFKIDVNMYVNCVGCGGSGASFNHYGALQVSYDPSLVGSAIDHDDAKIKCLDIYNCSDTEPGILVTQNYNGGSYPSLTFSIQCSSPPCASRDIYWHASIRFDFFSIWGYDRFAAYILGYGWDSTSYQVGNGGVLDVFCGVRSGSCEFDVYGVIPAEKISFDPSETQQFKIDVFMDLDNCPGCSGASFAHNGTLQVSYDPSLIGSTIPSDSVNCKGCPLAGTQGWAADPINTNTGALSYAVTDLEIPTSAGPLTLKRSYVSSYASRFTNPLGYGWVHNQDLRLIFPATNEDVFVKFKDTSGNLILFWDTEVGRYVPYAGNTASLTKNSGTPATYTLTDQAQTTYTFDQAGKIISLVNSTGQTIAYTYNANQKLEHISADGGARYFDFTYNAPGQLNTVTDHAGRHVSFGYNASGDLSSYTDVLNQTWNYEYQNHLLTRVKDPNSQTVERNEYYADGRAWKQFDGNDNLVAELTYNADGTTTVTDALGNDITHTYDARGTLTGNADPLNNQTQKTYDSNFRVKSIQDAAGNPPTSLTWSSDGVNLEYIKDGLDNETFISYGGHNNPINIIDAMQYETKYFYTDPNFPALPTRIEYPLSFDGGVTWVGTDYEYYPPASGASAGKVKFVTDALGNQTHYTYTSSGQTESVTTGYGTPDALTTTYGYDDLGRLVDVTDEQGVVTHNEYDAAAHLTRTIHNVHPSISTQNYQDKYNIVTGYRYDLRGNQTAVIDTYGVITRTYYDLANRPVTVVQNLVGQSIETETPPNGGSGTTNENIRTDTVYDDAGNVTATLITLHS